jgi:cytochrome c5
MTNPISTILRQEWPVALLACGLAFTAIVGAAGQEPKTPATPPPAKASHTPMAGEEIFDANCARCHTAPMTLSPRVTGIVVEHMRVRARMSRQEEKLLLKYLAP